MSFILSWLLSRSSVLSLLGTALFLPALFGSLSPHSFYEVKLDGAHQDIGFSSKAGTLHVTLPRGQHTISVRRLNGYVATIAGPVRLGEKK